MKIDKYGYLIVEETLLSDQSRMIQHAKFTYFPLVFSFYSLFRKGKFYDQRKKT